MEITYETRKIEMVWDVAVRLEMVLGVPAKFWNKLESTYREKLVKANAENDMDADKELAKKIPYREMSKNGWVPETRDTTEKVIYLRIMNVNLKLSHGTLFGTNDLTTILVASVQTLS